MTLGENHRDTNIYWHYILIDDDGEVAVFDATNTTRERRKFLHHQIVVTRGYKLFFVESICDDASIIESNIKEVKIASPDYVNVGEVWTRFNHIKMYSKFIGRGCGRFPKTHRALPSTV